MAAVEVQLCQIGEAAQLRRYLPDTASAIITDTAGAVSVMMASILSVMSMVQAWVE